MKKYAVIKVGRKITNIIDMEKGVRQGDGIAPVLFNIALEIAIRRSKIQTNGTIFTKSQQILAYADDLVLTSRRIQDLEEMYIELEKQTKMLGLKINIQKSKYMNVTKKAPHQQTNKIQIGVHSFDKVNEFVYLGSLLTSNNELKDEINRRISIANRAYYALLPIIKSKIIARKTKLNIYKTLIRPIVTYGAETWTLTKSVSARLAVFERKVLRRILGAVKQGDNWRIRYNSELYELYNEINLETYVKLTRLRWLGHVVRMDNNRRVKIIHNGMPEGTRTRGRPRQRWMDNVMTDVREFGILNWKEKASNRDEWKRVLREVKAHKGL